MVLKGLTTLSPVATLSAVDDRLKRCDDAPARPRGGISNVISLSVCATECAPANDPRSRPTRGLDDDVLQ
jgi:hypothetical protein